MNIFKSIADEFLGEARLHGLPKDQEAPFLGWVGNEVWEGRAVADFAVLQKRVCELVSRYKKSLSHDRTE